MTYIQWTPSYVRGRVDAIEAFEGASQQQIERAVNDLALSLIHAIAEGSVADGHTAGALCRAFSKDKS